MYRIRRWPGKEGVDMTYELPENIDARPVVVIGGGPAGENVAQYAIKGTDLTAVHDTRTAPTVREWQ